jgi:galactitol-specific phosphotransferase system IIB component
MLVRLLKLYPHLREAAVIREKLEEHLSSANLQQEAKLFETKENKSFERMYGWAWLLRLVAELETWDDPQAKAWRENFRPLELVLVNNTTAYLPKLTYPIRTGEHTDTGFALAQLLDYARIVNNTELETLIVERAMHFYRADTDYPTRYEPSGHDFFSPCWNEADLMRRVLKHDEFAVWLKKFLPGLTSPKSEMGKLLTPVEVSDVTDGKLVHLAGLDLSRAWCLNGIASSLKADSAIAEALHESSIAHGRVGMSYVFSGHYEGDHWLATFAVYWLTEVGIEKERNPN